MVGHLLWYKNIYKWVQSCVYWTLQDVQEVLHIVFFFSFLDTGTELSLIIRLYFVFILRQASFLSHRRHVKKKSLLYAHNNKNVDVQLSINRYDRGRIQNRGSCLSSDNLCNIFQRPSTMSAAFNLPKQILRYNEKPAGFLLNSSLCCYTKFKLTFSSSCAPSSMQMCFYIPHLSSSAVTFKGGIWIQTVWFASRVFYSESVLYSHIVGSTGALTVVHFFSKVVQTTICSMQWKSIFS